MTSSNIQRSSNMLKSQVIFFVNCVCYKSRYRKLLRIAFFYSFFALIWKGSNIFFRLNKLEIEKDGFFRNCNRQMKNSERIKKNEFFFHRHQPTSSFFFLFVVFLYFQSVGIKTGNFDLSDFSRSCFWLYFRAHCA